MESTLIEKHESVVTKEDENSFSPNKSPLSAPSPPSPPQVAIIPKTFAEKVLHKLDFAVDGGPLCQDFVKGNLSEAYQDEPTDELLMQYFQQVKPLHPSSNNPSLPISFLYSVLGLWSGASPTILLKVQRCWVSMQQR